MTRLSVCGLGVSCNEMNDTPMLLVVKQNSHWGKGSSRGNFQTLILRHSDKVQYLGICLLSVTLELHSPTILFVIISGYNVPLRYFLIVCYCFCTILNYFHLRKSDVSK